MDLRRLRVRGVVQGVGFRPFVYRLAHDLGLTGSVGNDAAGVWIDVCGTPSMLAQLPQRLSAEAPPLACISSVSWEDVPVDAVARHAMGRGEFVVSPSVTSVNVGLSAQVPPDAALCHACRAEVQDPANRRYRYPLISCTDCGPRYTIIAALPYDRPRTSMAHFPLCAACQQEYDDPSDRRFHAQPISCFDCGPTLRFGPSTSPSPPSSDRRACSEQALSQAVSVLLRGGVLAIKGLGGYHLACNARAPQAVASLRERKGRGDKPLAVLVRDLAVARELGQLGEAAEQQLRSAAGPIVLVRPQGTDAARAVHEAVAPRTSYVGMLLPPTSLHLLLTSAHPELDAVVLTSCNVSDEPICIDDDEVLHSARWDAVLWHDRPILHACDDAVVIAPEETVIPVRASRGMTPLVVDVPDAGATVVAVGGDLKSAVCVLADGQAWMGPHLGDAAGYGAQERWVATVSSLLQVRGVTPEVVVADAHPGYHSGRWAQDEARRRGVPLIRVQHHHAHVASLMAEHGLDPDQQVLGVAFDGTGDGRDGTVWGGEFLLGSYARVERVAHLALVPLPGGDAAIRHPARTALAFLHAAGESWSPRLPPVTAHDPAALTLLESMLGQGSHCVATSSIGRVMDAVAALCGLTQVCSYEAQAAMELEAAAWGATHTVPVEPYPLPLCPDGVVDSAPLIRAIVSEVFDHVDPGVIALRLYTALAHATVTVAEQTRDRYGVTTVGLTGGVFLNALLTRFTQDGLQAAGFTVLTHRRVSPGDGGLALGQALIAHHLDRTPSAPPLATVGAP